MKLLSYTVVVRYQAIILDFWLTLSLSENQLVRVVMLRSLVIFPRWKYANLDFEYIFKTQYPVTRNDRDLA